MIFYYSKYTKNDKNTGTHNRKADIEEEYKQNIDLSMEDFYLPIIAIL